MWHQIELTVEQSKVFDLMLQSFETDRNKVIVIKESGKSLLVIDKIIVAGFKFAFSPGTYEFLAQLDNALKQFLVKIIDQPENIGTKGGWMFTYGNSGYYQRLSQHPKPVNE
jgi:hypothetical protein